MSNWHLLKIWNLKNRDQTPSPRSNQTPYDDTLDWTFSLMLSMLWPWPCDLGLPAELMVIHIDILFQNNFICSPNAVIKMMCVWMKFVLAHLNMRFLWTAFKTTGCLASVCPFIFRSINGLKEIKQYKSIVNFQEPVKRIVEIFFQVMDTDGKSK